MFSGLCADTMASPISFGARIALATFNQAPIVPAIEPDLNFATSSFDESFESGWDNDQPELITTDFDSDFVIAIPGYVVKSATNIPLLSGLGGLSLVGLGVFRLSRRTRPRRRDNGQFHRRKLAGQSGK